MDQEKSCNNMLEPLTVEIYKVRAQMNHQLNQ